jgi:hypothetical protein
MKDPRHCAHSRINRVIDSWFCNDCGAEFYPVNPWHRTKWSDESPQPPRFQAAITPEMMRRENNE